MNTSSNASRKKNESRVGSFSYPEAGGPRITASGATPWGKEDDSQAREAATRDAGRREGEAQARTGFLAQLEEIRRDMAKTLEEFARERREYYLHAERELVQLSLSIAKKILHRESNIDPLLLMGMVRVLLETINQTTKVTVRVHPLQVSDFRAFFARHMSDTPPEVLEDVTLEFDRCAVHSELGTTEIGPEIQLKEIEQGLLDLKAANPASK